MAPGHELRVSGYAGCRDSRVRISSPTAHTPETCSEPSLEGRAGTVEQIGEVLAERRSTSTLAHPARSVAARCLGLGRIRKLDNKPGQCGHAAPGRRIRQAQAKRQWANVAPPPRCSGRNICFGCSSAYVEAKSYSAGSGEEAGGETKPSPPRKGLDWLRRQQISEGYECLYDATQIFQSHRGHSWDAMTTTSI